MNTPPALLWSCFHLDRGGGGGGGKILKKSKEEKKKEWREKKREREINIYAGASVKVGEIGCPWMRHGIERGRTNYISD